ncbi:MAG: glycosyltransferase family 39 protein [Candidatus Krumholzibacteriia bacterium]
MVKKKKQARKTLQFSDRYTYLLLLVVSVLVRIPFLKTYDMVTYDGTYYINHAKTFLGIMNNPIRFPIGYPIFIALFMPLIRDGVRAAQTVSFLAGLGSLLVFYSLAKRFVRKSCALAAAFILALTPLFMALSMLTLSESIYLFWVLLGLLFFAKDRDGLSGLFLGMAAITRPEALGILGVLAILRLRRPKKFLWMVAGFTCLFCVNVAVQSISLGKLTIYPHVISFGSNASSWKFREAWIDSPGKEKALEAIAKEGMRTNVFIDYLQRMPREVVSLILHVSPVIFILSLYGICRKRLFLLAALVPFVVFPLFTFRSEPRFIFPYVPVFILYAFIALDTFRDRRVCRTTFALLILSAASGVFINRAQLTVPILPGSEWAKEAATSFKGTIKPGARIADRDPFLAFYLEGTYVEIPIAPLDETLEYLAAHDTEYLVLHKGVINTLRSSLNPLLYDRAVIIGEMRFAQHGCYSNFVIIYKRIAGVEPVKERYLVPPLDGEISGLSWSPDGRSIAYCLRDTSGIGTIHSISPDGGSSRIIVADLNIDGQIAWAPDSKRIAFTSKRGGKKSVFVSSESGDARQVTSHPGTDAARKRTIRISARRRPSRSGSPPRPPNIPPCHRPRRR